jgi:hypothetical protein
MRAWSRRRAPLWQTVHRGCPGLLRGFSSSSDATRGFSSGGDTNLPAVVHPAEARAVRVLTAVLTTLLTPLHRPSDIKDECHRETFDGPERQAGETLLAYANRAPIANVVRNYDGSFLARGLHSHPSLLKLHDALKQFSAERGTAVHGGARGFTQDVLETVVARNGGDAKHAAVMMDLLDTDGDGVVSFEEFWAYHVVMEDGRTQNKVDLLLRGGADGRLLGRAELGSLVGAAYLTAMGMRGKTSQLPLLEALVDQRLGAIPTGVEESVRLLAETEEPWQDGHPVATLDVNEKTTVRQFADTVGAVTANYCFAIANKSGTKLDSEELASWVRGGSDSYRFVEELLLSTLYTTRKDRSSLVRYLTEHHERHGDASVADESLLGILRREFWFQD